MFLSKGISEFKPHKTGLKKVLGDLEAEIMKIVWQAGEVTVRDVYEELRLEKKLAYTTVMTIMSRLNEKNLLRRDPRGSAFVYAATITEEEFASRVVTDVLDGLLEDFAEPVISQIVETLSAKDAKKLGMLEKLIRERREKGDE